MKKGKFFSQKKQSLEEQFLLKVICLTTDAGTANKEHLQNLFFALDEEQLWKLSVDNQVTSLVAHGLANLFGWEKIAARWRKCHDQMVELVNLYCDELDHIAQELGTKGIRVVALKNNGIALALHPCRGCCPMTDIDVLIDVSDQKRAHTILVPLGYKPREGNIDETPNTPVWSSAYFKIAPSGQFIFLDVHWEAIGVRWMVGDLDEISRQMVERSLPIAGSNARILAPEDNLLQVILHNAKHAHQLRSGLRRNLDVHHLVLNQDVNWTVILNFIHTHKIKTSAYLALSVANTLLNTPVPQTVLEEITPPMWKRKLFRFIESAWLLGTNKNVFEKAAFYFFRVLMYDDLKLFFRTGIFGWHKHQKKTFLEKMRRKINTLLSKTSRSIMTFSFMFEGPVCYRKIFKGSGFGVVFEDDGQEGYVYLTKEHGDKILDGLKLYDRGSPEQISKGELLKILWHPVLKKVGVLYHGKMQAIFDLKKRESCCRTGFPLPNNVWCKSQNHFWDGSAVSGFEGVT